MALEEHGFFAPEEANDFLTQSDCPEWIVAAEHERRQPC
jgi:hypothetical protein